MHSLHLRQIPPAPDLSIALVGDAGVIGMHTTTWIEAAYVHYPLRSRLHWHGCRGFATALLCFSCLLLGLTQSTLSHAVELAAQANHPWQATIPGFKADAYFTNIRDGDSIETPFVVKFGLSGGWGLAPVASPSSAKSGHHHLLINRSLPLDFKQPLPFNKQYIHFGQGQMETTLTLDPGVYTLRLLLANQQHLPHFVYSKPVTITVAKKGAVDSKRIAVKSISISLEKAIVSVPFRVQFHASNMNVAHVAQQEKDTGHFVLVVLPADGGKAVEFALLEGQTEIWLQPPNGDYSLRLEFRDNLDSTKLMAPSVTTRVKVVSS